MGCNPGLAPGLCCSVPSALISNCVMNMEEIHKTEKIGAVLVCGAGVAGIQAALDLAESGFKVYLLETTAAIGGRMPQLDKLFPAGDCAMCVLSPKLVECARNENVEIITLADIEEVSGGPGNFSVKIRQNPRYIDLKKCDACGNCAEACPVSLPSEFDDRVTIRKAIFRPYPQAIPSAFTISKPDRQAPCKMSCPAGVNVPGLVALTAAGKLGEAYELLWKRCPLPAVSGRICRNPCETGCSRNEVDGPVAIRQLEQFVADYFCDHPEERAQLQLRTAILDRKVAVVGSGPAGLTAAADLALMGYRVTLFEANPYLGGMLRYGIPGYRLPREILDKEIGRILQLGIEVQTGTVIDSPKELLSKVNGSPASAAGFDAVFVATGAWLERNSGIPGENADGVWGGLRFLHQVNAGEKPAIGPRVAVIGGDDTAIEAARCAIRIPGVKYVGMACLESMGELRCDPRQLQHAIEEGVNFHCSLGPTRIDVADGKVTSVKFRACTSVLDEYRRFDPLFDDTAISSITADTVILTGRRTVDSARFGLDTRPGGRIFADPDTLATSVKGIFSGGDSVLGPASMIDAVSQGHRAAQSIDTYLRGAASIREISNASSVPLNPSKLAHYPRPDASQHSRIQMLLKGNAANQQRSKSNGNSVLTRENAIEEAGRCLSCGMCSECMQCVASCSAGAVIHDQRPASLRIEVGSIVLAPGLEESGPVFAGDFGIGRYPDVVSGLQFERVLALSGPAGPIKRPSDGEDARKIAFIQCVGSREGNDGYCSTVCCMTAAQQSTSILERRQDAEVWIFGKEVRPTGKGSESCVNRLRDSNGSNYVRAFPSRVRESENRRLKIHYCMEGKAEQQQEFDLVVLSMGLQVSDSVKQMAARLGVQLNHFGFARTQRFSPLATSRPGIFLAGSFQEPKDIPASVAQASGAAACVMNELAAVRGTLTRKHEYPWERDVADESPRIGVFVCRCGQNIASAVDVERVARKASLMPGVLYAEANMYSCSESSLQHIKEIIRKHRLNRIVVASCSSRTHEVLFRETLRECGLNQYLVAMTNIRDECSWVHKDDKPAATAKAVDLVGMAVARARHLTAFPLTELEVTPAAMVLGGGIAGMSAALSLAGQGFKVHLVEKETALGGLVRNIHSTLEQDDVRAALLDLISKTQSNPNITLYLNSTLVRMSGQVGDFTSTLASDGGLKTVKHGAVIVATGGRPIATDKFLYGRNPRVFTQAELESAMADDDLPRELRGKQDPTVVMIQCVESRDEKHPYCSRVCCSEAIKNALQIKRRLPYARIVILNRDIRTYGFRDHFFMKARKQGILFYRYPENDPPLVAGDKGLPKVKVHDMDSGRDLNFSADLLVLSTGISPAADNPAVSGMLRSALNSEGFFIEAHPKLRPVDLPNEGEFVCGLAHSPRFMDETIAQAQAAAGRASRVLSKTLMEIAGQVSYVNPAECVACATCVRVCPYGAPVINALGKSEIRGAKCVGCGGCVSACPAKAIVLRHQDSRTVTAMLDEVLAVGGRR